MCVLAILTARAPPTERTRLAPSRGCAATRKRLGAHSVARLGRSRIPSAFERFDAIAPRTQGGAEGGVVRGASSTSGPRCLLSGMTERT